MVHLKELPEYAKFVSCVETHGLLPGESQVLAAVSGGADSVAMLCLFLAYMPTARIHVAHVNHGIRGAEAQRDADFVRDLCNRFHVTYHVKEVDVPGISKATGVGIEETARRERYRFLQDLSKEGNYVIAVAHHREDRGETILMNLARGTGLDGLKGIAYRHNNVIRPLLDFSKAEIYHICACADITPMTDSTNLEDGTLRNRVRHHVIPYLSQFFDRDIVDKLIDLSEYARVDSEFLDRYTQEAMQITINEEEDFLVVDRKQFSNEDTAIQNRIIRKLIPQITNLQGETCYPEGKDLTGDIIQRIRNHLLVGQSGKVAEAGRRICCRIEGNRGVFYYDSDKHVSSAVKNPGIEVIPVSNHTWASLCEEKSVCWEYFDFSELAALIGEDTSQIELRQVRTGDVFTPFGLEGSMRLRKFLINCKIPISHRNSLWVVAIGNQILWIPGVRRSNIGRISKETKQVIKIKVELEDVYHV